jgi:hypothetical protein
LEAPLRISLLSFALSSLLLLPAISQAETFSFSALGSGGGYSGSGLLTADNNGDGSFTLTAITGSGITGIIAANEFMGNDNLLFPTNARLVDVNGFAFSVLQGGLLYSVNIFSTVAGYEAIALNSDGDFSDEPVSFSLQSATAVTPEPSSFILLATGLSSLGFVGLIKSRMV